ncbi:MAG: VWA domain-containing protein [Phycisphaerae bacterium]
MSWLTPMLAVYAAAASVPLLVLLYFLKLKRRQVLISSTLLWKRAVQDLQVNSPFQRIRKNILLLLQLLMLLALLAALGRPVVSMTSGPAKRYVLLIDRSASMNATDAGGTGKALSRLDMAKRQARELVDGLRTSATFSLQDTSDQAMVVAFDEHAKVMCNFTSDKRQLLSAIDSITPTDAGTALSEAIMVARAFAQAPAEANNRSSVMPAQLELFSDGRIVDADQVAVAEGELTYHKVGAAANNIGIIAMQARRSYEKASEVEVFATLANFSDKDATTDVQLALDGNIRSVRSVRVPRRIEPEPGKSAAGPGTVSVSFSLTHSEAGVIEVRLPAPDALADDDAAWAILPPPKALSALLVTEGNPALESAMKACPLAKLDTCKPGEFDVLDAASLSANPKWDVIVLDRHGPYTRPLPRGQFIVFGAPPPDSGVTVKQPGGELKNQTVIDWRVRHPVLQFVNLNNLFAATAQKLTLPSDAVMLAEFGGGPAIALVRKGGSTFLLLPFDCLETNWPFEPGFVMFCYNATTFLGLEVGQEQQFSLKVGQAITIEHLPKQIEARLTPPGGKAVDLAADDSGVLRYPATHTAGVYSVAMKDRPLIRYAVNLLDARESSIDPAASLTLSGRTVAGQSSVAKGNVEVWPWLVLLALLLACVEWFVYNWKVRI